MKSARLSVRRCVRRAARIDAARGSSLINARSPKKPPDLGSKGCFTVTSTRVFSDQFCQKKAFTLRDLEER